MLRSAVWDALVTCDLRDAVESPEGMMDDLPVLVNGPTGTGKEGVARALGLGRFIPFDDSKMRFLAEPDLDYHTVNVTALRDTLAESELLGHARGAFTGAAEAHRGWFETCPRGGTLFLDEIGNLAPSLQPKFLRVLETRTFQRVGETVDIVFGGRVVSATHEDLSRLLAEGKFRLDLLQRLCALTVRTPSLREQLDDEPDDLRLLLRVLAEKTRPTRAEALAERAEAWIHEHLRDYDWPGNVRQLLATARRLEVHRNTVSARIDPVLLAQLSEGRRG